MATKSVFISFDYDHDRDLRGSFVAQVKDQDSPFSITDWSLREPITEKWKKKVRDIIRRTDLTIVICGEHTHDAAGVENAVKFQIIHQLEEHLPVALYDYEWQLAGEGRGTSYSAVTHIEKWIPRAFIALHIILLLLLLLVKRNFLLI